MDLLFLLFASFICSAVAVIGQERKSCSIPFIIRGAWFSWENGQNTLTEMDATSMSNRASCVNVPTGMQPTVENVCTGLHADQQLITLFSENFVPVNCRSSLEGVWQFAYQNRFRFTDECSNPGAQIHSCQTAGSQCFIANQKFNITYKQCSGMKGTFDRVVEYSTFSNLLRIAIETSHDCFTYRL